MMKLLTDKENAAAAEWQYKHRCKGKAARVITVTATPTGIGTAVELACTVCGKTKNVTDYESW